MRDESLVRHRQGMVARVVMTALMLVAATFFGAMAVLVSHDSALECQSPRACRHIERYPFGVVQQTKLEPIERASVAWSPGGRTAALKLVLHHEGGTISEYPGVGKNGERAQTTAEAISSYLLTTGGPEVTTSFALREGSLPVAIFLALLALTALVLLPYFFARVRLVRSAQAVEITIERWPAPPRRYTVAIGEPVRVLIEERTANGQQFYSLHLERADRPALELGLSFRSLETATREQELVAAVFR